jgi:hypothetical protein
MCNGWAKPAQDGHPFLRNSVEYLKPGRVSTSYPSANLDTRASTTFVEKLYAVRNTVCIVHVIIVIHQGRGDSFQRSLLDC